MAQASGVEKAKFESLDGGGTFTVQFNPKELKLDEKASWKASDEHGEDEPHLTYEKGDPTSLSMELIFDTSDTKESVNTKFIVPLRGFMTAQYEDAEVKDAAGGGTNKRPCYAKFIWGGFEFDGVVEKVNSTFLMFDTNGTPIRAKVQIGMKERKRPQHAVGAGFNGVTLSAGAIVVGGGSAGAVTGEVKTYTVQEGDTLTTVAANTGAESRNIAEANGIGDPLDLTPGEKLVIPMTDRLAKVLAKRRQNEPKRNYKDTEAPTPFDESRAVVRNDPGPSALDEANPVGLGYDPDEGDFANAYISFGPEYEAGGIDSDGSIGEYGATGAGDGVGAHAQHGANPVASGEGATAAEYNAELGDGSIGEYGATGAGDGVGAHTQNGANPVAGGEGASAAEYNAQVGDGSVGEYGASGAGDGVGAHTQHGANPVAGGEGATGAEFNAELGDGSVGEYGASGAGDGAGAHSQGGANATADGMGAGGGAASQSGVGDNAISDVDGGPRTDMRGDHSSSGADPIGAGRGADRDGNGVPDRQEGRGRAGGAAEAAAAEGPRGGRGGRGGGGGKGGADGAGGGRGPGGPEGQIDVDTKQMREDNTEAEVSGGGAKLGDSKVEGESKLEAAGMSKKQVAKKVAKKMEAETGEKPENMAELKKGAKAMGLGEVIRQAKDNAKDNPSE